MYSAASKRTTVRTTLHRTDSDIHCDAKPTVINPESTLIPQNLKRER